MQRNLGTGLLVALMQFAFALDAEEGNGMSEKFENPPDVKLVF